VFGGRSCRAPPASGQAARAPRRDPGVDGRPAGAVAERARLPGGTARVGARPASARPARPVVVRRAAAGGPVRPVVVEEPAHPAGAEGGGIRVSPEPARPDVRAASSRPGRRQAAEALLRHVDTPEAWAASLM
jgi:hypothetical protein